MKAVPLLFLLASLPLLSVRGEVAPLVTRLLDTGSPSTERESAGMLTIPTAWSQIPEDQTNYQFSGDAVLRNDKLAVVLRKKGNGVDVYSRTAAGLKHRAKLNVVSMNSSPQVLLEGLDIVENTSAGVGVAVKFSEGGTVGFRLTTGEATLEVQSSEPADFCPDLAAEPTDVHARLEGPVVLADVSELALFVFARRRVDAKSGAKF